MITVTPSNESMSRPRRLSRNTSGTDAPWQSLRTQALVTRLRVAASPAGLARIADLFLRDTPATPAEVQGFLDAATTPLRLLVSDLLRRGILTDAEVQVAFADRGREAMSQVVATMLTPPERRRDTGGPVGEPKADPLRRRQEVIEALRAAEATFTQEETTHADRLLQRHYAAMAEAAAQLVADLLTGMDTPETTDTPTDNSRQP